MIFLCIFLVIEKSWKICQLERECDIKRAVKKKWGKKWQKVCEIWIVPVFKVYCDVCIVKNWRHPSLEIGIHIIGGLPYGSLFFSK